MDSQLVMWAGIVGFFMPVLLAVVQQPGWSTALRSVVMFVASILAALGTVYLTSGSDAFTAENMVTSFLTIMVTAIATYKGFYKETGIAPKIEIATSPKPKQDAAG